MYWAMRGERLGGVIAPGLPRAVWWSRYKRLSDVTRNGTPGQRKALLKELVVDVRVESRESIIPTFRVPTPSVRATESLVGRRGLEPSTSALDPTERCANDVPRSRISRMQCAELCGSPARARSSRYGDWVLLTPNSGVR